MADQVNKIIFVTKESYEEKKKAGTLEQGAVYAIDAAQAASSNELKDSFDEFGVEIGINKKAADFYGMPLGLKDLLRSIVKDNLNPKYNTSTVTWYSSGTREQKIKDIITNGKTTVSIHQDGKDYGFAHFTNPENFNISNTYSSIYGTSSISTVSIPEGVDVSREYQLKIGDMFGSEQFLTVDIKPDFEPYIVDSLIDLDKKMDYTSEVSNTNYNGNGSNEQLLDSTFLLYNSKKIKYSELNGFNAWYHGVVADDVDLSTITDIILSNGDFSSSGVVAPSFRILSNISFTKYVDIAKGVWRDYPESVKAITTKLGNRYQSLIAENNKLIKLLRRAEETLGDVDFTDSFRTNGTDINDSDTEKLTKLADAKIIGFTGSNMGDFDTIMAKAAAIKPLKFKVLYATNVSNFSDILQSASKYPTLKAIGEVSSQKGQLPAGSNLFTFDYYKNICGYVDNEEILYSSAPIYKEIPYSL